MNGNWMVPVFLVVLVVESGQRLFVWKGKPMSLSNGVLYWLCLLLPMAAVWVLPVSVLGIQLGILALSLAQHPLIQVPEGTLNYSARMRFLFFSSLYLSVLGGMALVFRQPLAQVVQEEVTVLQAACVALGLLVLLRFTALVLPLRSDFPSFAQQREKFHSLYRFMNLNILYLLFQSGICGVSARLEEGFAPLLCTNLLTLVFLSYYLVSIYSMLCHQDTERFHDQLKSTLQQWDRQLEGLRQDAYYDSLTGARSRLYALQTMEAYLGSGAPFALVYLDLNGLKALNDSQGHPAGDAYLRAFVQEMGGQIRQGDLLARYGGDEFLILMLGCSAARALERIQEIRGQLGSRFPFGAGVADTTQAQTLDGLLDLADQRMYADKRQRKKGGA